MMGPRIENTRGFPNISPASRLNSSIVSSTSILKRLNMMAINLIIISYWPKETNSFQLTHPYSYLPYSLEGLVNLVSLRLTDRLTNIMTWVVSCRRAFVINNCMWTSRRVVTRWSRRVWRPLKLLYAKHELLYYDQRW